MNNNPRVLILGPSTSRYGGIAGVLRLHFKVWNSNRYEYKHISVSVEGTKIEKAKIFFLAVMRFVIDVIRWRPDIVHIHFSEGTSFYRKSVFVLLSRLLNIITILHCHANNFQIFYETKSRIGQKFIMWIFSLSDSLVLISKYWCNYFETLCPSTKLALVNNPVVFPKLGNSRDKSKKIVLSLGRLEERKGTYDILEAAPLVVHEIPGVHFNLAGDGDVEEVKKSIEGNSWQKNISILGWVEGQEKESAFREASVFLLPSYHEGLPLALLEAMSYGLPIISCPVGGIPDAIEDAVSGVLIEPGNVSAMVSSLINLLNDKKYSSKLGRAARKQAQAKFEAQIVLDSLYDVYDSLIK